MRFQKATAAEFGADFSSSDSIASTIHLDPRRCVGQSRNEGEIFGAQLLVSRGGKLFPEASIYYPFH
jgi:hypothetical protein